MRRIRPSDLLGYVPSLEALPLFGGPLDPDGASGTAFQPRAYSSYGSMARDLLTGTLGAAVLPWEIFISDLLVLPSQEGRWVVSAFLHPCPMELVLGVQTGPLPSAGPKGAKMPRQLAIGVESRNSLTQMQIRSWINGLPGGGGVKLSFKMLPMELMGKALRSEAVDGIVAPTPWGIEMELKRLGRIERNFQPGRFVQDLVFVQSRDSVVSAAEVRALAGRLAAARMSFREPAELRAAAERMARHGRPVLPAVLLESAAAEHASFFGEPEECTPDEAALVRALENLAACAALPVSVVSTKDTAGSLVV